MKVLTYLDCGCAIMGDGRRAWCPSCLSPEPTEEDAREDDERRERRQAERAAQAVLLARLLQAEEELKELRETALTAKEAEGLLWSLWTALPEDVDEQAAPLPKKLARAARATTGEPGE